MVFHAAAPVGERSSRGLRESFVRNRWILVLPEVGEELRQLKRNELDPELTPAEHQDLLAQLNDLVRRGVSGELRFDHPGEDAEVMRRSRFVIELKPRLTARSAFGRPPRHLRMYYAEPQALPDVLLALRIATKADGRSGYNEQDGAVDVAEVRANGWAYNAGS